MPHDTVFQSIATRELTVNSGIVLSHPGVVPAIDITSTTTTIDVVNINANSATSGIVLDVTSSSNSFTGTYGLSRMMYSGTSSGTVLMLYQSNASATGKVLHIQSDGTGQAIIVDKNNTGLAIEIDKDVATSAAVEYGIKIACDVAAGGGSGAGIDLSSFAAGEITINFPDGNASALAPQTVAPSGWINIAIAGTVKYIPYYAAS